MATITANAANFEQLVDKEGIVLIDWWAPWCGPCKTFGPIYEEASAKHDGLTFAKINTDDEQDLAMEFQIQAVPTLMVFRDRVLVFSQAGALPGPALDELIKQVQALNMDEVRKEIEDAEAAEVGAEDEE